MNRVSAEHRAEIKRCISRIPKDYEEEYNEIPFELFIYEYQEGTNISDLDGFADFDGTMTSLEKAVSNIISRSKERLSHIDFKWIDRVGDFDQFTIYSV